MGYEFNGTLGSDMRGLYGAYYYAEHQKKLEVWSKGFGVFGLDPTVWRQDFEGRLMKFDDYGNTSSLHGWQYDHITPKCIGGSDEIFNLRPRNWFGNQSAGGYLSSLLGNK